MREAIVTDVHTTNGGPQGQVQPARNFNSLMGRFCASHACLNLQDASPIENQAIYNTIYVDESSVRGKILRQKFQKTDLVRNAHDIL